MAICPLCQNALPDDFGLIECSQCGAPLFVDMDGNVEHQGAEVVEEPVEEASEPMDAFHSDDFQPVTMDSEPAEPEFVETDNPEEVASEEIDEDAFDEEPAPADPPPTEGFEGFSVEEIENQPEPQMQMMPPSTPNGSQDLSDLSQFANSSESGTRDGNLRYTVFIDGIDTADIREGFRDVVSDRRFLWDTDRILRSIKDGQVKIEDVSAVKALLLIHRLRSLPLKVKWEQYAIHQS